VIQMTAERIALVRRGLWLNYFSIGYNIVEAVVALVAGIVSGSVALVGFGIDSAVEVSASGAAQWRLRSDSNLARRDHVERITLRVVGAAFLILAVYVTIDSLVTLWEHEPPEKSVVGLAILVLSALIMPVLARAKKQVGRDMGSKALVAEATQTSLCAWLSVIALAGVGLNYMWGLWWADPIAALAMVPIIAKEGVEGLRGESTCSDDCRI
jgi:divalent metal cation (Fe/Co/Zn/Cd) transporter